MREINFEHYKIFYYVAKFQNITMAANYLFLSQPSISRCVKKGRRANNGRRDAL